MASARGREGLTIAELEHLLDSRRGKLTDLERERNKLQKRLDDLDQRIAALSGMSRGRRGGGGGGRAQNAMSLVATIESVLKSAGKPLPVGDIMDKVQQAGYRSNSDNFRALINQTLIKERKRFAQADRGVYGLKK